MKKTTLILIAILSINSKLYASSLACANPESELARCHLVNIKNPDEKPMPPSWPVEALLCTKNLEPQSLDFIYRAGDQEPLTQSFIKNKNHYISNNPNENIRMTVDKKNNQIKITELILRKQITSIFSCILW